jgi:hypothetical protein
MDHRYRPATDPARAIRLGNLSAAEQGDEADEAFGGMVARMDMPPHARAVTVGRGHRFAAYPRCSADQSRQIGGGKERRGEAMGLWSLDAYLEDEQPAPSLDRIARECIAATGDPAAKITDDADPFQPHQRLGKRIDWVDWWICVQLEVGASLPEAISNLAAERLHGCTRRVRVIFGPDDSRRFTDYAVCVVRYLEELSGQRVLDPQQGRFTT